MSVDLVVRTDSLSKRFSTGTVAVRALSIHIRRGEVYGFLGPNGAGKTTTLRMLLGLVRPTGGSAMVLGHEPGAPAALTRIGALVESPAFYPHLSARDNLAVMARHAGVSPSRVDAVLDRLGMAGRANERFKNCSLGMKQRVGVAAAMLKDPELLILDEPTNGLDPAGVSEMRALIRDLGRDEHSVLLSSHLLSEVEQVCDRVGVIQDGSIIAEGTVAELRRHGGQLAVTVRADPLDGARHCLERLVGVDRVQVEDGAIRVLVEPSRAAEINRLLVSAGIDVSELRVVERSLEEAFLQLTHDGAGQ